MTDGFIHTEIYNVCGFGLGTYTLLNFISTIQMFLFVTFWIAIIGDNQKHDQSQRQEADREDTDVIFTKDYWVFWTDFVYYSSDYHHNKADEHKQDIWSWLGHANFHTLYDEIDNSPS